MDAPEKMALTIQGIMIAVFNLENSEHIDVGRVRENIYWDCYRGYTTMQSREDDDSQDISFEEIECTFYQEHYGKYIEAQNERNARTRHTERNRSVEDLLKNNKTCPEETIFSNRNSRRICFL